MWWTWWVFHVPHQIRFCLSMVDIMVNKATHICNSFRCVPTIMPQRRNLKPSKIHPRAYNPPPLAQVKLPRGSCHLRKRLEEREAERTGEQPQDSKDWVEAKLPRPCSSSQISLRKEKVMAVLVSAAEALRWASVRFPYVTQVSDHPPTRPSHTSGAEGAHARSAPIPTHNQLWL